MIIDNMNTASEEVPEHPEETHLNKEINRRRVILKERTNKLKDLKAEVDALTVLLQKNQEIYVRDLERYLSYTYKERQ